MLLDRGEVNPDQADTSYGRTPLWWAALGGHEGVVKMLLDRGDVNPDQADTSYGRTPLSLAASRGHEGVVQMLLERKDVSSTTLDLENETPLSRARSNGHEQVVRLLLDRGRVNSPGVDCAGRESPPASSGHGDCAVALKFKCATHITDISGQHALPSPDPGDREPVSDLPSIEQPTLSKTPPRWPLSFWSLRRRADPHPDNTRSTLSFPVVRYFIVASLVCLFAFLVYTLLRYLK
ncbi:ankyrin repeat-containing domain protein [Tuber indicum]|nr:ankyrin repeat-containing domain protein [Tuber indicum]